MKCEFCTPTEVKKPDGSKSWEHDVTRPHPMSGSINLLFPQAKSNTPKKTVPKK